MNQLCLELWQLTHGPLFSVLSVATRSTLIKGFWTGFKTILPAQVVPLLVTNTFFTCPLSALLVAFQKVVESANPLLPRFEMPVQRMSHCKFLRSFHVYTLINLLVDPEPLALPHENL